MPPQLATIIFTIGIAGLFWLERDRSVRVSKALWLPALWLSISGSRSVSVWLGMAPPPEIPGQPAPTSLLDQFVAATLMLCGAIVLRHRKNVTNLLRSSWPIVVYFSFCLVSLLWSDFPAWGLKRWVRSLGDLIMVLIVATEAQPAAAWRRLFSRVGFVLLPVSLLFIKYYPELGRGFDEFGGQVSVGVTSNKNMLGNLVFVIALAALWQVLSLVGDRNQPNRSRRLLAQGTLLAFGINLLVTAQSATSMACFVLGAALMLSVALIKRRPAVVHALVFSIAIFGGVAWLFEAKAAIASALGRKPDLTGRTEIWKAVIPMAPNPIGGAGFETFWVGPRVARVFDTIGGISMTNEAHNGYIEVYLNLGGLGLILIALVFVQAYGKIVTAYRRDRALGALLLAYLVTAVTFNITEAGFRMLSVEWFCLLLSVITASRVSLVTHRLPSTVLSGRQSVVMPLVCPHKSALQ